MDNKTEKKDVKTAIDLIDSARMAHKEKQKDGCHRACTGNFGHDCLRKRLQCSLPASEIRRAVWHVHGSHHWNGNCHQCQH